MISHRQETLQEIIFLASPTNKSLVTGFKLFSYIKDHSCKYEKRVCSNSNNKAVMLNYCNKLFMSSSLNSSCLTFKPHCVFQFRILVAEPKLRPLWMNTTFDWRLWMASIQSRRAISACNVGQGILEKKPSKACSLCLSLLLKTLYSPEQLGLKAGFHMHAWCVNQPLLI